MRQDQKRLDKTRFSALIEQLRKHGVSEDLISAAINDIDQDTAA